MGIHGIFKEIGPGQRISLAKLSVDHFVAHEQPLRLAIDISIWLFQIQAGKGGSNPALRTFYYRLLRLLSLNIHPLFVFDGPNKPLFKRNKKVGGPGVRVASVPEFLAKQLLKQFGFPWHVAPGEAEAECALLQREGMVDAVLSEDVDTLMFGSGVTLRNWSAENTSKTPTHVSVYRAEETKEKSGLDREGMILVALMSGGDYITEGIPGCGPKLACDAARAGYGKDLCAIPRKDSSRFRAWRERLQYQICTNEDKIFSRRNTKISIPDDFPNLEVLGYYTQPCVSTPDKLSRLRASLKWDQIIDFPALRSFTADAFDWRCVSGAKKFIRNLAPAMLVRELRLSADQTPLLSQEAQAELERKYIRAIHGKRNHSTTDGQLEYRISYVPVNLVPIDLSIEEEDDGFIQAGGPDDQSDADSELAPPPSSSATLDEPPSPTKKRAASAYNPEVAEKLWVIRSFLRIGCPTTVEDYEASLLDPKALLKQRRTARAAANGDTNVHASTATRKKKTVITQTNKLSNYMGTAKLSQLSATDSLDTIGHREPLRDIAGGRTERHSLGHDTASGKGPPGTVQETSCFKQPSSQQPLQLQKLVDRLPDTSSQLRKGVDMPSLAQYTSRPFAAFLVKKARSPDPQRTPKGRKRPSVEAVSPALSQKTIQSFWSPPSVRHSSKSSDVIDLISPSPTKQFRCGQLRPTPPNTRGQFIRDTHVSIQGPIDDILPELPDSVTKRRKRAPLKRHKTAPTMGVDDDDLFRSLSASRPATPEITTVDTVEAMDLASPLTVRSYGKLASQLDDVDSGVLHGTTRQPAFKLGPNIPRGVQPPAHLVPAMTLPNAGADDSQIARVGRTLSKQQEAPEQPAKKKRIQLRESLEGAWKDTEVDQIDLSGDGTGWRESKVRAQRTGWRTSGVEVLDLTGA